MFFACSLSEPKKGRECEGEFESSSKEKLMKPVLQRELPRGNLAGLCCGMAEMQRRGSGRGEAVHEQRRGAMVVTPVHERDGTRHGAEALRASRRCCAMVIVAVLAAASFLQSARGATVVRPLARLATHATRLHSCYAPPDLPLLVPAALAGAPQRDQRRYGEAIATAGTLVAIGAPTDGDDALSPGAVAVLRVEAPQRDALTLVHCVTFSATGEGDHFGASLAMQRVRSDPARRERCTTLLAIGADRAHATTQAGTPVEFAGAVEIYRTTASEGASSGASEWIHEATLTSAWNARASEREGDGEGEGEGDSERAGDMNDDAPQAGAEFGSALAFCAGAETLLAIGSPRLDVDGQFDAGQVEVFSRDGLIGLDDPLLATADGTRDSPHGPFEARTDSNAPAADSRSAQSSTWRRVAIIRSPEPQPSAWFGRAIALNEDWLAIGAPGEDDLGSDTSTSDDIQSCGAVHLFRRSAGGYDFLRTLHASKPTHAMWFGSTVALDGDRLAVGAPNAEHIDARAGAVFLVDLSRLDEQAERLECPIAADGAGFGGSLTMRRGVLLIGAASLAGQDSAGASVEGVGSCWLYDTAAQQWIAQLAPPSAQAMALFGGSCALIPPLAPSVSDGGSDSSADSSVDRSADRSADSSADATADDDPTRWISLAGHLYAEEEAVAPSPGVAFYRSP